jgi:PAS domain S-box-containing protein
MNFLPKPFKKVFRKPLHEPPRLITGLLSYIDQENFQELLESAPDAMLIVNEQGRIIFVTVQLGGIFGYQSAELLQKEVAVLIPERFHTELEAHMRLYFQKPYVRRIGEGADLYGLRKDGSEFPIEVSLSPFETDKGIIVSSAIRDVTERENLEKLYRREHNIAITYQEASLPKKLPEVLGLVFHSFYGPGKNDAMVGGDWYDAVRLLDGRVIISIGDVSGSGLQAAVIMSNMRQVIRGSGYVNPNPVLMLNAADKMLRSEYPSTNVTAFVGILDPIERTLSYASAGHPSPFLRLPDGTLQTLSSQGLILGLRGRDEPTSELIAIEEGSRLILYTDGLTESTRNYAEGEQRLRIALENPTLYDSSNIAKTLYDVVLSDGAQDDVAILTVEWGSLPIKAGGLLSRWIFDVHDADAAVLVRRAFTQQLQAENISPEDIAMAELVFMELIGNVVRYAPGQVEIVVDWSGVIPVLHAIDHGPGFSHSPKLPDLFAESGRGIYLIAMLTEEFEILKVPGGGSHACAVLLLGSPHVRERKHIGSY